MLVVGKCAGGLLSVQLSHLAVQLHDHTVHDYVLHHHMCPTSNCCQPACLRYDTHQNNMQDLAWRYKHRWQRRHR